MRIIKLVITICLAGFVPMIVFGTELSDIKNIFQAVDFIEDAIHFDDITIKSAVPYEAIQDAIQKYCPLSAVQQAQKEAIPLNEVWSDYLGKPNINKSLSDRFDLVKGLISELKQENSYKYCKDSYLLFSILKTTQDLYSGEKEVKTKKVVSTQNKVSSSQNVQTSTKQTKSETITMHGVVNDIDFTFVHDTAGLPKEARNSFYQSTDKYLHEIMADLVNIGILDNSDLKTMNYKIKVTYQQSCEVTEGAFRVMRNKQTGKVTFKEIELIIAYCDKNNTPERQKRHVQQILAHELGHYIYFFKDKNPSKFSEICRDNGKMNCLPQEFVSNYAKKSQEEDYAESFAYWYLYSTDDSSGSDDKHGSAPDNPINRRARYFEELFEKEDDEDDDDEDEKK